MQASGRLMDSKRSGFDFLAGGGEMGALMRAFDWNNSSLGSPDKWPQSLRVTVRLLLNTGHPMFIWWGPDLIQFYNDAYRRTLGPERHPGALGQRGRECWAEIWDIIGPQIDYVMTGNGSTWDENRLVPVTRNGRREDVWWTYSYGPIDLEGGVGGVLVVCNDVTAQHVSNEALKDQSRFLRQLFELAPGFMAVLRGPDHVFELTNAAYRKLLGDRDIVGKPLRDVLPEIEGQGYFELLDEVYRTGKPHVGRRMPLALQAETGVPPKQLFLDFVYAPIVNANREISGVSHARGRASAPDQRRVAASGQEHADGRQRDRLANPARDLQRRRVEKIPGPSRRIRHRS
jgi:PAS domain-containing protein